ncbi:MAG: hypothetical protein KJO49_07375 [Bacteroidia bacterium]|nr:hypothetical protein [Bacteroidia bacterium]MBT8269225.1 hypothetical protein [Bacteroidia bacterium]NNK69649.1 hypothetical protein [Flavobacteriaceae bacterium]NNL81454.1 hypothetical protein [Flavobacteriaceae bacterium]
MKQIAIYFFLTMVVWGCKNSSEPNYIYQDQPDLFSCSGADMKMVKEGFYVFENYIAENYAFLSNSTDEGYYNYIKLLLDDRSPASEFFSDYLVEFKDYLKERDEFWVEKNGQLHLNYDYPLVNCLINNIKNEQLRNTIDALVSSNTVRPETLGPVLYRNHEMMASDKALAAYVIFETFYPKLFYMDSPEYVPNSEKLRTKEPIKKEDVEKIEDRNKDN